MTAKHAAPPSSPAGSAPSFASVCRGEFGAGFSGEIGCFGCIGPSGRSPSDACIWISLSLASTSGFALSGSRRLPVCFAD